jgi:hypothetical protein
VPIEFGLVAERLLSRKSDGGWMWGRFPPDAVRAFAAWADAEFVQRVVAQLPWGHNVSLLLQLPDGAVRQCPEPGYRTL